jgi:hypothetical protein
MPLQGLFAKPVKEPRADITFQVAGIIGCYFVSVFKLVGTDEKIQVTRSISSSHHSAWQ